MYLGHYDQCWKLLWENQVDNGGNSRVVYQQLCSERDNFKRATVDDGNIMR